MLKKKDWKELMQEFVDKVDKREQLIQDKIDELKKQGAIIQTKIRENSDQMIELEMNEDTNSVEKFKKENRNLRLQLDEIQDSISGYESQLGTSRDYYAKDWDKIRAAAKKAEEDRIIQEKAANAEIDDLQAKIDELKEQREQKKRKLQFSRTTIEELSGQLRHIDPRAIQLSHYTQQAFIKTWLHGGNTESYFEKKESPNLSHVTHIDYLR
ncbi:hypothetical protein ACXZ7E_02605 [Paenibacillus lautus]